MTLQQLRFIREIYTCRSVVEAAKRLCVAQPSMSNSVRRLEKEFNITIFKRNSKGIEFTEDGLKFVGYAQRILAASDELKDYYYEKNEEKRDVRLTVSSQHYMFPVSAVKDFMTSVHEDTSSYSLHIREKSTKDIIDDVCEERSEIGIVYVPDEMKEHMEWVFDTHDLNFTPIGKMTAYAYVREDHPLAKSIKVTPEELTCYPSVWYDRDSLSIQYAEDYADETLLSNRAVYVSDRLAVCYLIRNTDAYHIGLGFSHNTLIPSGIVAIPVQGKNAVVSIGRIQKKKTRLSQEVREYLQFMTEKLK